MTVDENEDFLTPPPGRRYDEAELNGESVLIVEAKPKPGFKSEFLLAPSNPMFTSLEIRRMEELYHERFLPSS